MKSFKNLVADAVAAKKIREAETLVREHHRVNEIEFNQMEFYPTLVECRETPWGLCVAFSDGAKNHCAKYLVR